MYRSDKAVTEEWPRSQFRIKALAYDSRFKVNSAVAKRTAVVVCFFDEVKTNAGGV